MCSSDLPFDAMRYPARSEEIPLRRINAFDRLPSSDGGSGFLINFDDVGSEFDRISAVDMDRNRCAVGQLGRASWRGRG